MGFSDVFIFRNHGLECQLTGKMYTADDLEIVEYHRFRQTEDESSTTLYAVECRDGKKGIAAFSPSNKTNQENPKVIETAGL